MQNFFLTKILRFIGRKLDGHKTQIGSIGAILLGVVHLLAETFPDAGLPKATLNQAMLEITGGLTGLGIGGKLQKQTDAMQNNQAQISPDGKPDGTI